MDANPRWSVVWSPSHRRWRRRNKKGIANFFLRFCNYKTAIILANKIPSPCRVDDAFFSPSFVCSFHFIHSLLRSVRILINKFSRLPPKMLNCTNAAATSADYRDSPTQQLECIDRQCLGTRSHDASLSLVLSFTPPPSDGIQFIGLNRWLSAGMPERICTGPRQPKNNSER